MFGDIFAYCNFKQVIDFITSCYSFEIVEVSVLWQFRVKPFTEIYFICKSWLLHHLVHFFNRFVGFFCFVFLQKLA